MKGFVFLWLIILVSLASCQESRFAGSLSVSLPHAESVEVVKLLTTMQAGVSVAVHFNASLVTVCADEGSLPDKDCTPIAPYSRFAPTGKGFWWFLVRANVSVSGSFVPVEQSDLSFYIDFPMELEMGKWSMPFSLMPNEYKVFVIDPRPVSVVDVDFRAGGLGWIGLAYALTAVAGGEAGECEEGESHVCTIDSSFPVTSSQWVLVVRPIDPPGNCNSSYRLQNNATDVIIERQIRVRDAVRMINMSLPAQGVTLQMDGNTPRFYTLLPEVGVDAFGLRCSALVNGTRLPCFRGIVYCQASQNGSVAAMYSPFPYMGDLLYGRSSSGKEAWFLKLAQFPQFINETSMMLFEPMPIPDTLQFNVTAQVPLFGPPTLRVQIEGTSYSGVMTISTPSSMSKQFQWLTGSRADETRFTMFDPVSGSMLSTCGSSSLWLSMELYGFYEDSMQVTLQLPQLFEYVPVAPGKRWMRHVSGSIGSVIKFDAAGVFTVGTIRHSFNSSYVCTVYEELDRDTFVLPRSNWQPLMNRSYIFFGYAYEESTVSVEFAPTVVLDWLVGRRHVNISSSRTVVSIESPRTSLDNNASMVGVVFYPISRNMNTTITVTNIYADFAAQGFALQNDHNLLHFVVDCESCASGIVVETSEALPLASNAQRECTFGEDGGFVVFQILTESQKDASILMFDLQGISRNALTCVQSGTDYYVMSPSCFCNNASGLVIQQSSSGNETWFFAISSPSAEQFIVSVKVQYARVVCSPETSCNGHGFCPSDDHLDLCECVGFEGTYCGRRVTRNALFLILPALGIVLCVTAYMVYLRWRDSSRQKEGDASFKMHLHDDFAAGAHIAFESLVVPGRVAGCSGEFLRGELTCILGVSGAGKSSLLAALVGNLPLAAGSSIFYEGERCLLSDAAYRDKIGLVPQIEFLYERLSVEENVSFSGSLRLKESTKARKARVQEVLRMMQLEEVRHSIVSEISGGQRRRCSIAMELVCNPCVLFCDEPTSGLDSESALSVMSILHRLAKDHGRTVVAVIHQPSFKILKLIDHVIVLQKGGIVGWDGPGLESTQADSFVACLPRSWRGASSDREGVDHGMFGFIEPGENLADWLLERVNEMREKEEKGQSYGKYAMEYRQARRDEALLGERGMRSQLPSLWHQFWVFAFQSLLLFTRKYRQIAISVVLILVAAVILGVIFKDNVYIGPVDSIAVQSCPSWLTETCKLPQVDPIPAWSSVVCLCIGLTSLAMSIDVFLPEIHITERNRRAGVSISPYYLARNVFDGLPNVLIPPLLFCSVFYFLMRPAMSFGMMYGVLVVVQFTAVGLGYMASLVVQSAPFLTGCILVLISVAFSGVTPSLAQLDSMVVVKYLTYASYARWGVEALYLLEVAQMAPIYDVQAGLDALDYFHDSLSRPMAALLILGIVFRIVGLLVYAVPFLQLRCQNWTWWKRRQGEARSKRAFWIVFMALDALLIAILVALIIYLN